MARWPTTARERVFLLFVLDRYRMGHMQVLTQRTHRSSGRR
ncbi:MAG TPA: hypothetical protein VLX89_02120 [Actinomycetota bacterium]|nr:hypothetical protein [Actinomycetota bacterium]